MGQPDSDGHSGRAFRGIMKSETALAILAVLAVLYTAYAAQNLIAPITASIVASFILSPLLRMRLFRRLPAALTSAILVITLIATFCLGVFLLYGPVSEWAQKIPEALSQLRHDTAALSKPVQQMQEASETVEEVARSMGSKQPAQTVIVREPGLLQQLMAVAGQKGASILVFFVLLYFLLSSIEVLYSRIVSAVEKAGEKEKARRILRTIEREISHYLASITLINIGLGVAIGLSMWALGLPDPLLWGALAALFNFVPYAGVIAGMALTGFASYIAFGNLAEAFYAPLIYFFWNAIESQIVTPTILGKRHTLNAAIVFVSIVFWGWLWGVIGAVLAVPILVIANAICAHVEHLKPISYFIDGTPRPHAPLPE
ncbi:AI-2E family transporter [Parvibaculum sp. MBR-TMA-1.3b-4.2]